MCAPRSVAKEVVRQKNFDPDAAIHIPLQSLEPVGECQGSCRVICVTIRLIDEVAAHATQTFGDLIRRLVMSVPWCSLRRRSGARHPRHARAQKAALRVAAGGSAPLFSFVARHGLGAARSGRESRFSDRTGSWICEVAARATVSRSGLRVTAPTCVQLRVCPLQRCGLRWRASW